MHDFYRHTAPAPLDQADGLRRLFAGQRQVVLPLAANPHVAFSGVVLDRLAAVLAAPGAQRAKGRRVLVVDAAALSPQPPEIAALDLAACIEPLSLRVGYLPARGLPKQHVDTRGSGAGFIDALTRAAPQAEVILLHADAQDMARMFRRRGVRALLLGADHPESIKHAYAGAKLLAQRCGLLSFDLILAASAQSPRGEAIAQSLGGCIDSFLGAVLCHWARVDPTDDPAAPADAALARLLAAQLALDDSAAHPSHATHAHSHAAAARAALQPAF